jgi:hypothetical protein
VERGNPVPSPSGQVLLWTQGRLTVRQAVGGLDWRAERSEGFTVMVEIPVETGPAP